MEFRDLCLLKKLLVLNLSCQKELYTIQGDVDERYEQCMNEDYRNTIQSLMNIYNIWKEFLFLKKVIEQHKVHSRVAFVRTQVEHVFALVKSIAQRYHVFLVVLFQQTLRFPTGIGIPPDLWGPLRPIVLLIKRFNIITSMSLYLCQMRISLEELVERMIDTRIDILKRRRNQMFPKLLFLLKNQKILPGAAERITLLDMKYAENDILDMEKYLALRSVPSAKRFYVTTEEDKLVKLGRFYQLKRIIPQDKYFNKVKYRRYVHERFFKHYFDTAEVECHFEPIVYHEIRIMNYIISTFFDYDEIRSNYRCRSSTRSFDIGSDKLFFTRFKKVIYHPTSFIFPFDVDNIQESLTRSFLIKLKFLVNKSLLQIKPYPPSISSEISILNEVVERFDSKRTYEVFDERFLKSANDNVRWRCKIPKFRTLQEKCGLVPIEHKWKEKKENLHNGKHQVVIKITSEKSQLKRTPLHERPGCEILRDIVLNISDVVLRQLSSNPDFRKISAFHHDLCCLEINRHNDNNNYEDDLKSEEEEYFHRKIVELLEHSLLREMKKFWKRHKKKNWLGVSCKKFRREIMLVYVENVLIPKLEFMVSLNENGTRSSIIPILQDMFLTHYTQNIRKNRSYANCLADYNHLKEWIESCLLMSQEEKDEMKGEVEEHLDTLLAMKRERESGKKCGLFSRVLSGLFSNKKRKNKVHPISPDSARK